MSFGVSEWFGLAVGKLCVRVGACRSGIVSTGHPEPRHGHLSAAVALLWPWPWLAFGVAGRAGPKPFGVARVNHPSFAVASAFECSAGQPHPHPLGRNPEPQGNIVGGKHSFQTHKTFLLRNSLLCLSHSISVEYILRPIIAIMLFLTARAVTVVTGRLPCLVSAVSRAVRMVAIVRHNFGESCYILRYTAEEITQCVKKA